MSSLGRKLKRDKLKDAKKELTKKVGLFNKIPDHCLACHKEFDKKDRDMVMTWSVVVRKETETVRLYCPECWDMAKKLVEETRDGYTNSKNNV